MLPFVVKRPATLEEAIGMLSGNTDGSILLKAGGTDIIPWMNKHLVHPETVVDLSRVSPLSGVDFSPEDGLKIGALASVNTVAASASVRERYHALRDAALSHSDQIIRNKATVVGNVCAAIPSADMVPALLVYDAIVHIVSSRGSRDVPLADFTTGPRKTVLTRDEIVTCVSLPVPTPSTYGIYLKLSRRNALDLAQVGVACVVTDADHSPKYAIACGAVAPRVMRITDAEDILNGIKHPADDLIDRAAEIAMNAVSPISDVRASIEYRRDQVCELVRKAVKSCLAGAHGGVSR